VRCHEHAVGVLAARAAPRDRPGGLHGGVQASALKVVDRDPRLLSSLSLDAARCAPGLPAASSYTSYCFRKPRLHRPSAGLRGDRELL